MSLTSSSESRCFVGPGADDHNLQLLQLCKKMPGTWLQIILIHTSSKCAINFHTSSFIILTRAESFMQRVLTRSSAAKWHCLFSEISEICSDISLQFSDFVNFFQHQKNVWLRKNAKGMVGQFNMRKNGTLESEDIVWAAVSDASTCISQLGGWPWPV